LRGKGQFVGDITMPGMAHAAFLRSAYAHARLERIDTRRARDCEGVLCVLEGSDIASLGPLRAHLWTAVPETVQRWLRPRLRVDEQLLMAVERVRCVGEAVAVVVADDRQRAADAVEQIEVRYQPLPVVVDPWAALEPDAPRLHAGWPDNVALHLSGHVGDVDAEMERAAVRTRLRLRMHRHTGVPIETRACVASVDLHTGLISVWTNTQLPHALRDVLSEMLGVPVHRLRVVSVDVGGGFGIKGLLYPEDVIVPWLALRLGRPVKWVEDRREHFTAAIHSRDQVHDVELCASEDGRLLAFRDHFMVDTGCYNPSRLIIATNTIAHMIGPYRVRSIDVDARVVVTNKMVSAPYRGAGRPEAVWALERAMDRLARAAGLDPVEFRRRNTLTSAELPLETGMYYRDGSPLIYDSGDYLTCLERAVARIGYPAFRAEQADARANGRYIGLGVAAYTEGTGIGPFEGAVVDVDTTGHVMVHTGACSQGQGHATVYAQICADSLGVRLEDVTIVGGDTSGIMYGWGTVGSRSTVAAGSAIARAARLLRDKALRVAGELLEVAPTDLQLVDGSARVIGAPERRVELREVAQALLPERALPVGREPGLRAEVYEAQPTVTWANGVHAVTVEVDVETGRVDILRYVVVHDCGRLVNPLLAEGQVHGGVVQGLGGALLEEIVYDEAGQLVTGSLMDYALPRATEVPRLELEHIETPSPRNLLGVKGIGEGGAIPVAPALANAVEDALLPFGVLIDTLPLKPEYLQRLLHERVSPPG
jgi:aerobic carbon-monoxide dehydrogenase large subunit